MDIAINVYVWNHKDYRNPNQKKKKKKYIYTHTHMKMKLWEHKLMFCRKNGEKNKGFVIVRVTYCIFFQSNVFSSSGGIVFFIHEYI